MTKPKFNRPVQHSRPWAVTFKPEILEYLAVPTKYGTSRLSAYLSLLQATAETVTSYKPMYGQTFDLEAGQLVISITDLAEQWNWARETVRKFLGQLEVFRLLSKKDLDRCSLLTMSMVLLDTGYTSVFPDNIPDFKVPQSLTDKMDEWLSGDITDSDMGEECEEFVKNFDNTDIIVQSYQINALLYSLIRQLVSRWAVCPQELPLLPDKHSRELLGRLWKEAVSGNWTLWLSILKEYSPGACPMTADPKHSKNNAAKDAGRAILYSLFIHLKVDFVRN